MRRILAISFLLSACASSTWTQGRPFDVTKIPSIEKGKTTAGDLRAMFGEPFTKSTMSATEEKWVYSYIQATTHATAMPFSPVKAETTGLNQALDILLRDGVVLNFTFSEGPYQGSMNSPAAPPPTQTPTPSEAHQ